MAKSVARVSRKVSSGKARDTKKAPKSGRVVSTKGSKSAGLALDDERPIRHRLAQGLALKDLDDAAGFVEELGLLLQTPHPFLPSLFAAVQGKPAKPGAAGFGQWPEHAWSWAGELAERDDVLLTKVILGKRTLVHERLWPALDAAVRGRKVAGDAEEAIVETLRANGAVRTDHLRKMAGLESANKSYQKAMGNLEALGVVIARPITVDNHKHVASAELWETKFKKPLSKDRGADAFVLAALRAAGVAPEREVIKWFAWPKDEIAAALRRLVAAGKATHVDGSFCATAS